MLNLKILVVVCLYQSVTTKYDGLFDVLKISDVPFPQSSDIAAVIKAPYESEISEFSVCYRMLIDFYNDGMVHILKAWGYRNESLGPGGVFWQLTGLNTGLEVYGFQPVYMYLYRNIPGGGLGNRAFPYWHFPTLPKNMDTGTWYSICTSYSSKLKRIHMFQDGLKVFSFQFIDEEELPLRSSFFSEIEIGKNMRGLLTDFNIYSKYFEDQAMIDWTSGCDHEPGDIYPWDKNDIDTTQQQNGRINVTFVSIDRSVICPDPTAQVVEQTLTDSTTLNEKRRFTPRFKEYTSFVGSILEFMNDPYVKSYNEAIDLCMRLNGYLLTIPQNDEELEFMDKTIWDFKMKRASNNLTFLEKNSKYVEIWNAAETKLSNGDKSSKEDTFLSRELIFPNSGEFQLYHTLTGEPLSPYRPGDMMIYAYNTNPIVRKQCVICHSSIKNPNPEHTYLQKPIGWCQYDSCSQERYSGEICSFIMFGCPHGYPVQASRSHSHGPNLVTGDVGMGPG